MRRIEWGYKAIVFGCLISTLLWSCNSNKKLERPWVMRSVLDNQPRMLSIKLDPLMYLAYDLGKCQLSKAWIGGIRIEGAPYTDVKNIQPTSWGTNYTNDEDNPFRWLISRDQNPVKEKITSTGYLFENNEIKLGYRLILGNDTIFITEKPEFFREGTQPGLKRIFQTTKIPEGVQISLTNGLETFSLASENNTVWQQSFESYTMPKMPTLESAYDHRGRLIIDKSDCGTCHELEQQNVGPSYYQIAERYAGQKVKELLTDRIINGSSGYWGEAIMTPHPNLSRGEIRTAVDYILSLAKDLELNTETPQKQDAPKRKKVTVEKEKSKPGFGAPLEGVHPSYDLFTLHREDFQPRVGALAFLPDGRLLVSTWDEVGGVYLLDSVEGDSSTLEVKLIASGLDEPLGLEVVDGKTFVVQKHELTQLIDHDGDEVIDEYKAICNSWGVSNDFHEFAFGLVHQDDHFYVGLSMAMRLLKNEQQHIDRGRVIKIAHDGTYESINYGMRTPNGVGVGPEGEIFATDNQGQWLPGNKLVHVRKNAYMGMQWGILEGMEIPEETPPAIWLPQNEIGNSPSEPILINEGPYKGQMLHGEVTNGGIKRDFLEKINGQYQGAVFRFTQGMAAGINRIRWGPDGHLYAGGVGMVGGWSWKGRQFGLQRLEYNDKPTFEMLAIRAKKNSFEIEMTQPMKDRIKSEDIIIKQWRYKATSSYGGPKLDLVELTASSINFSEDRKKMTLKIPGLKAGHVIYFQLPDHLTSSQGLPLWSGEAWYTLNEIPNSPIEF